MTIRHFADVAQARALAAWRVLSDGEYRHKGRSDLLRKQRRRCYLCVEPMDLSPHGRGRNPLALTDDHVFPRAAGGGLGSNILLAHRRCNNRKDSRWPTPCEVIYLAAMYARPYDAVAERLKRGALLALRANRRRLAIEQANA